MLTIITRSWLVTQGLNPRPDLASIICDHEGRREVTWADVMQIRRERQSRILELRRRVDQWQAYKVWVAYFDQDLMGGWQAFIENRDGCGWIDRDRQWLRAGLMRAWPLLLPFGAEGQQWRQWKPEFAKSHERRRQDRRPVGVAYCWWNGRAYDVRPA